MQYFLYALGILIILAVVRMVLGPTIWDRLLVVNQLSNIIVISIVLLSLITNQSFLLDIAIVYTLFSFVSSVLIARFIRGKGEI